MLSEISLIEDLVSTGRSTDHSTQQVQSNTYYTDYLLLTGLERGKRETTPLPETLTIDHPYFLV